MFTGIIEETGTIRAIRPGSISSQITVSAERVLEDVHTGDSICVNGVCLTVISFTSGQFTVDVMPETMRRTNLGTLKTGSMVNLERAMRLSDRFGGHIVSGHIDGTGKIGRKWEEDNALWFEIATDPSMLKYIADKGSVAIDGISLTVVSAGKQSFTVSVIPHTRQVTTLTAKRAGDLVNIECDILAKYIEKLTSKGSAGTSGIDMDFLAKNNFL